MKILFLSRWCPWPVTNGSKLRIYNLLHGLAQYHEITLLTFADEVESGTDVPEVKSLVSEVHVLPWKPYEPDSVRSRLAFLSLAPRSMVDTFSPEMARCIQETLSGRKYDLIIASQVDTARYHRYFQKTPALFEEVEVGSFYERIIRAGSTWQRMRAGLTLAKHQLFLSRVLQNFKAYTVVSEKEQALIARFISNNKPFSVIPNSINLADYQKIKEEPQPDTLIFTGSFRYHPNFEGMVWFLREVFPQIRSQVDAQLTITGDHADMPLPFNDKVILTGSIKDVRPLIARSWVSLAPIFHGGGTRIKILEAMALRTPVVSTTKGAEGLNVKNNENILIADTPEAYSAAVIRLLKEPDLREYIINNALQLIKEKYDWEIVLPIFLNLIQKIQCCEKQKELSWHEDSTWQP